MPKTIEGRKEETKAVKEALRSAGLKVRSVKHGRGTAYGWLHVYVQRSTLRHLCLGDGDVMVEMTDDERGRSDVYRQCLPNCPVCAENRERGTKAQKIVLDVTGRTGDYDGRTIVEAS